jgi:hypothetical protein
VREQQEDPGEALLAGVEELVHQVLFDPHIAREQVGDERLRELGLAMEETDHRGPAHPGDARRLGRTGAGHAERLAGQAPLPEEAPLIEHADDRFLPPRGDDRELDPSVLDEEHGVGGVPWEKDELLAAVPPGRLSPSRSS